MLRSAKTLLDADRAGLMLVDHAGALRWASASDRVVEAVEGKLDRLAQGPIGRRRQGTSSTCGLRSKT